MSKRRMQLLIAALLAMNGLWCAYQADGLAMDTLPDGLSVRDAVYSLKASLYLTAAMLLLLLGRTDE